MPTPRLHLLTIPSSPCPPRAMHPGRRFCYRLLPSRAVGRVQGRDFLIFCYISTVDSSVFCSILLGLGGLWLDWGRFRVFEVFWMCQFTAAQPPLIAATIIRGRPSLIINNQTHLHLQSSAISSDCGNDSLSGSKSKGNLCNDQNE